MSISGQVVYLNHEILDKYSDPVLPTLYKISGKDQVIKDFLIVLMPNSQFNFIDYDFYVLTICMLSSSTTVKCSTDLESSMLNSDNYAISTLKPLQVIQNLSDSKAVIRFTIGK